MHPERLELFEGEQEMLHASAKPIEPGDQHGIESPPSGFINRSRAGRLSLAPEIPSSTFLLIQTDKGIVLQAGTQ